MSLVDTFVEVRLKDSEDFLKIKETLTRIGIASVKNKTLYQSCHILHKQGKYYIVHFKELFALDGKKTDFTEEDRSRRDSIVKLLDEWGLIEVVVPYKKDSVSFGQVKILPFKDKFSWELISKYNIGKKRK